MFNYKLIYCIYYEYFHFIGGVFGLYDGRMDPLVTSCALGTNEVHYWGNLDDSLLNFRSDSPGYIIVKWEDHVARI